MRTGSAHPEAAVLDRERGDVEDPLHRVSYSFRRDGADLWVYAWLEAGAHLPEHFHPTLEERWEALDGTVRARIDGVWRDLAPADGPVLVARGVRHELRNDGSRVVRTRTYVAPAGRLEQFLTESARAARENLYTARGLPTSLRGAAWIGDFALRFRDETVMTSPPPALQRVVLPLLARLPRRG